jgi:hypothetical protein
MKQLEDPKKCKKELQKQRLIFKEKSYPRKKSKPLKNLNITQENPFLKRTSTVTPSILKKAASKSVSRSKIYSEKSMEIQSITDDGEDFNIFDNQSNVTLPDEITDFQIRLKSDFYEQKTKDPNLEITRFVGDDGFIVRAERKYLKGIDRANEIIDQKSIHQNNFQIQRDKILSIREIFKDFLEKIIEYIKNKYPKGSKRLTKR